MRLLSPLSPSHCCLHPIQTCGDRLMSRSEYTMALAELQKEIRTLRAYAVAAAADAAASAGGDAPAAEPASESAFAAGTGAVGCDS